MTEAKRHMSDVMGKDVITIYLNTINFFDIITNLITDKVNLYSMHKYYVNMVERKFKQYFALLPSRI